MDDVAMIAAPMPVPRCLMISCLLSDNQARYCILPAIRPSFCLSVGLWDWSQQSVGEVVRKGRSPCRVVGIVVEEVVDRGHCYYCPSSRQGTNRLQAAVGSLGAYENAVIYLRIVLYLKGSYPSKYVCFLDSMIDNIDFWEDMRLPP